MIPPAYVANPLADAVIHTESGVAEHIDVATYSRTRGFVQGRLTRGETPGFDAALRLLNGDTAGGGRLSAVEAMPLWQTGLILLPQECAEPFASPDITVARDTYLRHGFIVLPQLVTPDATRILTDHYRTSVPAGKLTHGDRQANRHRAHNDPAGRVALNALRETVERIVGNPIKNSYAYASLYCGGTDLPRHRDRPQCRYTLSLQIDHQPLPPDGRSPWPVQLHLDPDAAPVECFQTIGGGILFHGSDILHGRPTLPPDQHSWVLLLHYVDIAFDGPLD
ncbi:MAG: hypothetical protein KJ904_01660 [Alphaproteobacteria bacterium]|nr:hypothetical protein [Alphaproteobacteria bacterium]MBU0885850.1 hypothetical protein [Alphaproteobacteria bacterium]MBU1812074.1 hypothetical protein [Alphaproteobacteria bacterium]